MASLVKSLLVYIFFLVVSLSSFHSYGQDNPNYSLLWRIEGNGLSAPSYLFGTMHVKDARAFNFSDSVLVALEKSETFALELQPDSMITKMFDKMLEDDKSFDDLLTDDEYDQLNEKFKSKNGYDLDELKVKNPLLITSMLEKEAVREDDKQTFVDAYLYGIARSFQKQVYGLEKLEDQLGIFYGSSREDQKSSIIDLLDTDSTLNANYLESLTKIYHRGDLQEITNMIGEQALNEEILVSRNNVMTESIHRFAQQKSIFSAIGCAHLPGENGVIQLLRNKGYTVTRVAPSFTGVADTYSIDVSKWQWLEVNDQELGYTFSLPGPATTVSPVPGLDVKMYPDMVNEIVYMSYALDVRGTSSPEGETNFMSTMLKNFRLGAEGELITEQQVTRNGREATELVLKRQNQYVLVRLLAENNIIYNQSIIQDNDKFNSPQIDYFFENLKIFPPKPREILTSLDFKDIDGAFRVQYPLEPQLTSQTYPYFESDSIDMKIFMATDLSALTNYMVVYYDFPAGYFLSRPQQVFLDSKREFEKTGTLISPPDTIQLAGVEGREYKVSIQDQYFAICRVYVRGNRVYRVLIQNTDKDIEKLASHQFLSSFSFTPYEEATLNILQPDNENFKLGVFENHKVKVDTTVSFDDFLFDKTTYSTRDIKSGGSYILAHSKISRYFHTEHIDTLYNKIQKRMVDWNDSIVSVDDIKLGDLTGRDMILMDKFQKTYLRLRFWLDQDRLFLATAYADKESLNSSVSNAFFNAYQKLQNREIDWDIYSSKSELILKDLLSDDSTTYQMASGALNYYDFDESDLPLIYEVLNNTFPDDSTYSGVRCSLVQNFSQNNDSTTVPFMKSLYTANHTNDFIKSSILTTLKSFGDEGLQAYKDLLVHKLPTEANYAWPILWPFHGSTDMVKDQSQYLNTLVDNDGYRHHIINLFSSLAQDDSSNYIIDDKQYKQLTRHAMADLRVYEQRKAESEDGYVYSPKINAYLELLSAVPNKAFTQQFTDRALQIDLSKWIKRQVIHARVMNGLKIEKSTQATLLEDPNGRYHLLRAYYDAKRLKEVPKKYLQQEEFAKTCLINYLLYDNDLPETTKTLGTITYNNERFYAFSYNFYDEEGTQYIGLSGPFSAKSKRIDFNVKSYAPWEELAEDWQTQANEMARSWKTTTE